MSTKPCDIIRAHLDAVVDGELEPLETIAVRHHLTRCKRCQRGLSSIERLKVAVHVSGRDECLPARAEQRFARVIEERRRHAEAKRARWRWQAPILAAAAGLLVWAVVSLAGGPSSEPAAGSSAETLTLDQSLLETLVAIHQNCARAEDVVELAASGAWIAMEQLPADFMSSPLEGQRYVTASYVDGGRPLDGTSLAILRLERLSIDPEIAAALDTGGVFMDIIGGTDVRVSVSGDKVFVLLAEDRFESGGHTI